METAKMVAKRPNGSVRAPVRVKLERVNAGLAKVLPPDGDTDRAVWWSRLKQALGTTSGAFVDASLFQLQAAAQLPGSGISEIAVNAALAMIEAAAPKDEIEGALAVQMACTHTAAMAVISRLGNGYPGESGVRVGRRSVAQGLYLSGRVASEAASRRTPICPC